jgi:hypothetical protein
MTARDLQLEVRRLITTLLKNDLALGFREPVIRIQDRISSLTWASNPDAGSPVVYGQFAVITEYRRLLRDGHYSCVLNDGSLIQISARYRDDELIYHRYCYYPCPLLLDRDDIGFEGDLLEMFDLFLLEDFEGGEGGKNFDDSLAVPPEARLRLRSPVRFDFDLDQQRADHPASHLTFGHEECRWPVFGPLSLGHFIRFVFQHFRPEEWDQYEFVRQWPKRFGNRSVTAAESQELFVECLNPLVEQP